ncbi:MAG: START domain-containing protein [Bacteroidota bacterium]
MNYKTLVVLLITLMFMPLDSFPQTLWEIDKDNDGVVVYTRTEQNSDFKSFKAVALVDASIDEIIKVLKDADSYTKWYGYTRTSKALKQEKDLQYNYVETIFPWPYSNRDMVYRMSVDTSDPVVTKIFFEGIPDYIPEKKGIVRMQKAEGYILLKPLGGITEITYVFHSEPGAGVPIWLANNSIAELPFKTLTGLRKILQEEDKTGK